MKILLDTYILLWALLDDYRLSERARILLDNPDNVIYYSAASIWEIAIKHEKFPERLKFSSGDIIRYCDDSAFRCLPITSMHAAETEHLRVKEGAEVNRDPFDRILIAQAKHDGMLLLTRDKVMKYYDEPCIFGA